jgi:hypothetical protein
MPRARKTAISVEHARAVPGVGPLFERVVAILERARAHVVRSVNSEMVLAYWQIGREIVECHQTGSARAGYGDQLLEVLSARLQKRVGRGYSVTNLRYFRLFYQTYQDREPRIRHEPRDELRPARQKHHKPGDVSAVLEQAVRPRVVPGTVAWCSRSGAPAISTRRKQGAGGSVDEK